MTSACARVGGRRERADRIVRAGWRARAHKTMTKRRGPRGWRRFSLSAQWGILAATNKWAGFDEASFASRVALVAASLLPAAGQAQDTVKIGLIMPYSGQFADAATQMDDGVKLYLKQHGDKLGGMNVEIIRKDTGGIDPSVAKRLAKEPVTRDNVDILAGFVLTPNALAAADISAEAKKFMVVMNAATAIITTKSPYIVRTSLTVPQLTQTLGTWAEKNGLKKAYTMVTDSARASMPKARSRRASRRPAATSSARCAWRCRTRTSPLTRNAPRISIRKASLS